MGTNEYITNPYVNVKTVRNELIANLIKEEDYKKKDEKKKEIVKSCNSYKDFCNIVECVNMKPFKTYEKQINYEEYVNARYNISYWENYTAKQNVQNNLKFIKNKIKELSQNKSSPLSKSTPKTYIREIKQFIEILKNKRNNYCTFIASTYNCDDIKEILSFINNNLPVLITYSCDDKETVTPGRKLEDAFLIECLISFLFSLSHYWKKQNFSAFFTTEELNDIRSHCEIILKEIKKKHFFDLNDTLEHQFDFIQNAFS